MGINETFARTEMYNVEVTLSADQVSRLAGVIPGFSPEKPNVRTLSEACLNHFCSEQILMGRLELQKIMSLQNGGMGIVAQMSDGLVQSIRNRFQISGDGDDMRGAVLKTLIDKFIEKEPKNQPSSDASFEIKPDTPHAPFAVS